MCDFYRKNKDVIEKICALVIAVITVLACILPMSKLPIWNGEIPEHRNQYELITEAFLDGRLSFDYGDEQELSKLQNPYDPAERRESGVKYHWDHAYYNGKYYMYFGVVPVFLAFLPYRVITGKPLTTFRATQIFTAVFIAGIFLLFWKIRKRFFKNLPYPLYLALSVAFSVMSVWYASAEPALYCTPITAAIALEVFSILFFFQAVYIEKSENKQILWAFAGSLAGALVFGCRPPIGLASVVVLPMLAVFLKERKLTPKLFGKLVFAASPYLIVAVCLMLYNYARFENPFEFGQAYQLTVADQTAYDMSINAEEIKKISLGISNNLINAVFNFPFLILIFALVSGKLQGSLKSENALWLSVSIVISTMIISAVDVLWSPYILERYRSDIYFLLGIACYLILGFWYKAAKSKNCFRP